MPCLFMSYIQKNKLNSLQFKRPGGCCTLDTVCSPFDYQQSDDRLIRVFDLFCFQCFLVVPMCCGSLGRSAVCACHDDVVEEMNNLGTS